MVRGSGIREKLRSNVLKELARERGKKRSKEDTTQTNEDVLSTKRRKSSDDEEDDDNFNSKLISDNQKIQSDKITKSTNSLLSILPKPKNCSTFGPTVRIDKLLQVQDRADDERNAASINAIGQINTRDTIQRVGEDGMIEVDVSKVVVDIDVNMIKELTVEKTNPANVIVPRGKEKQKNQITYLAQLSKATELERKEQAAQSRVNKAAARSKYGW